MASEAGQGGILFIGKPAEVFTDSEAAKMLPCRFCENVLDGIDAAAQDSFSVVVVVMAAAEGDFVSAMKALRANSDGRILVVCRMYEEPRVRRLVCGNGRRLAEDYFVYPVATKRFCEMIAGKPERIEGDSASAERISRLEKLATEDDLTGLKNRRYLWEFGRQVIERADRDGGRVTLLVFDIDNFKHYNDEYGHSVGDEVLREAAVLMRRCCRRHDVVGRIGGDEFAVVFWDDPKCDVRHNEKERRSHLVRHPQEVIFIAKRFRRELQSSELQLLGPQGKGALTISGGLASLGHDGSTIEELFAQADTALLDAKRNGKNRIYLVGGPQNDIDKIKSLS